VGHRDTAQFAEESVHEFDEGHQPQAELDEQALQLENVMHTASTLDKMRAR